MVSPTGHTLGKVEEPTEEAEISGHTTEEEWGIAAVEECELVEDMVSTPAHTLCKEEGGAEAEEAELMASPPGHTFCTEEGIAAHTIGKEKGGAEVEEAAEAGEVEAKDQDEESEGGETEQA